MVSDRFVSSDTYNQEEAAVSMVQRHGEVPLSLTKKRRRWTPAEKQAIVTRSWSVPPSCPLVTCSASSTTTLTRIKPGTKALDCTAAGLAACPCSAGETRLDAGGTDCCIAPPPLCTVDTVSPGTACIPTDPTVDLLNMWECERTLCEMSRTTTYNEYAAGPPEVCPDTVETRRGLAYGKKRVTCPAICTAYTGWSAWGQCSHYSETTYKEKRTRSRTCNNPCSDEYIWCRTDDAGWRGCTPRCSTGSDAITINKTIAEATAACSVEDNSDADNTYQFWHAPNADGTLRCKCKGTPILLTCTNTVARGRCETRLLDLGHDVSWNDKNQTPPCECICNVGAEGRCTSKKGNNFAWDADLCTCGCDDNKKHACIGNGDTWESHPDCKCAPVGGDGGTYRVVFERSCLRKFLVGHADDYNFLENGGVIQKLFSDAGFVQGSTDNDINQIITLEDKTRQWGNVLKKMRCGAPGATAYPSTSEVWALNLQIRECTCGYQGKTCDPDITPTETVSYVCN